ncbi:MAG: UbiA family prenyltransferase, partial [Phycisphaerales bacterium]
EADRYLAQVSIPSRLRAWLELLRVPNLPTVASNAVLGAWLGFAAQGRLPSLPLAGWLDLGAARAGGFELRDLFIIVHVAAGLCALYLVGLVLNDLLDLSTDRRERPNRPLPSGRIVPWQATLAAIALLAAGVWLLLSVNRSPLLVGLVSALVAAIVLYDLFHRHVSLAVVLPALCRGLAVLVAAAATFPSDAFEDRWLPVEGRELAVVLVPAAVLAIFVLAVSVVARREVEAVSPQGSRVAVRTDLRRGPWWVVASGLLALVPAVMLGAPAWTPELADPFGSMQLLRSVVVLALLGVWLFLATRWTPQTPVPKLVGRWLGSLCILDAVMLAPLGPLPAALCVGLFAASALLARRFAGS